jgi:hypothetical protein
LDTVASRAYTVQKPASENSGHGCLADRRKRGAAGQDFETIGGVTQGTDAPIGEVYQLRAVLAGISPLIWRRLLVANDTSIAELHEILQTVFGWDDDHLHRFTIHAVEYGLDQPGGTGFLHDARRVRLSRFGLRPGERFTYEYDFIAGWRLDIRVEQIGPHRPGQRYPACTAGARAAPPGSCRSVYDYLALRRRWPRWAVAIRMAEILGPVIDADGDTVLAEVLGEYREEMTALVRLAGLDDFDRRAVNTALHAPTPISGLGEEHL